MSLAFRLLRVTAHLGLTLHFSHISIRVNGRTYIFLPSSWISFVNSNGKNVDESKMPKWKKLNVTYKQPFFTNATFHQHNETFLRTTTHAWRECVYVRDGMKKCLFWLHLLTAGNAKNEIPSSAQNEAIIFPCHVSGTASPYPTRFFIHEEYNKIHIKNNIFI